MLITEFSLKNITSYKKATVFKLSENLNIFIGPNGGGKTNALQALRLSLEIHIFRKYRVNIEGEDNARTFGRRDIQEYRGASKRYLAKNDEDQDSLITITIQPQLKDIDNILLIQEKSGSLRENVPYVLWQQISEIPEEHLEALKKQPLLTYTIADNGLRIGNNSLEKSFHYYCECIHLSSYVEDDDFQSKFSSPVFFMQAQRQGNINYQVQVAGVSQNDYKEAAYNHAANGGQGNSDIASRHLARLRHKSLQDEGLRSTQLFDNYEEVKEFRYYLSLLDFSWFLDEDKNSTMNFRPKYLKNGQQIKTEFLSSGETEIINFIHGIFGMNIRSGIVIVDEPELHLHAKWQKLLLNIFSSLSSQRNIQFIFSTHSATFVTQETLSAVTRIYQKDGFSSISSVNGNDLPEKKHLLQIINSHNNERLFFADHIILVEGITDRLLFEAISNSIAKSLNLKVTIEIIEVRGKHNFEAYKKILDLINMPSDIIADLDYLTDIGDNSIKNLFISDSQTIDKKIKKDKKSKDAASFVEITEQAFKDNDLEPLKSLVQHIKGRLLKLKENLTQEENETLKSFIDNKIKQGIYVLELGEIEAYLPRGARSTNDLIAFLEEEDWIQKIAPDKRSELFEIIMSILRINAEQAEHVINTFLK